MKVIIVCHTEFGIVKNRRVIATKDRGTFEVSVHNLMTVANQYGAKITFALCPEVAEYFPKEHDHEVGLHIHPGWEKFKTGGIEYYVGDAYLREHCKQSSDSSLLTDYSFAEQYLMISAGIKHLILSGCGVPLSFVAGRWAINNDTVKALIRNALLRDCSAMAHSHKHWNRLPRISAPYRPSLDDYQVEGDSDLLIIPISQMIKGGNVNPEMARIYGEKWLEFAYDEYLARKAPVFHMCLHSSCMADPFYYAVMDKLLRHMSKHGAEFKFASEINGD